MDINKANFWYVPVITGIIMIIFSIILMTNPELTFVVMTMFLGWSLLINGISGLFFYFKNKDIYYYGKWYIISSSIELITGAIILFNAKLTANTLMILIGVWLLLLAFNKLITGMNHKRIYGSGTHNFITAVILFILGALITVNPVLGMFSIVYILTLPMFTLGIIAVVFGFQIKNKLTN